MHQLHSDIVHRLDEAPGGKLEGDALMTNVPGLLLVIRTADCLPVLLVDAENRAVAAVHCGWRGTGEAHPGEGRPGHGRRLRLEARGDAGRPRPLHRGGLLRGRAGGPGGVPPGRIPAVRLRRKGAPARSPGPRSEEEISSSISRRPTAWLLEGLGFKRANVFDAGPACTHCEPRLLSYRRNSADPRRMYNFIGLTRTTKRIWLNTLMCSPSGGDLR